MVTLKTLDSVDPGIAILFCTLAKDELLKRRSGCAVQRKLKDIDFIINELSVEVLETAKNLPC